MMQGDEEIRSASADEYETTKKSKFEKGVLAQYIRRSIVFPVSKTVLFTL